MARLVAASPANVVLQLRTHRVTAAWPLPSVASRARGRRLSRWHCGHAAHAQVPQLARSLRLMWHAPSHPANPVAWTGHGPAAVSQRRSATPHSLTLVSHVWKRASVDAHCCAAASPLPWRTQSRAASTIAALDMARGKTCSQVPPNDQSKNSCFFVSQVEQFWQVPRRHMLALFLYAEALPTDGLDAPSTSDHGSRLPTSPHYRGSRLRTGEREQHHEALMAAPLRTGHATDDCVDEGVDCGDDGASGDDFPVEACANVTAAFCRDVPIARRACRKSCDAC